MLSTDAAVPFADPFIDEGFEGRLDFLVVSSRGITLKLDEGVVGLLASSKTFPCDFLLPKRMFLRVGAILRGSACGSVWRVD